jgi:hypothetical protein
MMCRARLIRRFPARESAALEHLGPAIYNIDDDPAAVRDRLPLLADALGVKHSATHRPGWPT